MRDAERRASTGTPEEFAEACLPASNWDGDEWRSRRASIARMVKERDAATRERHAKMAENYAVLPGTDRWATTRSVAAAIRSGEVKN